jgi:hypothetical protein
VREEELQRVRRAVGFSAQSLISTAILAAQQQNSGVAPQQFSVDSFKGVEMMHTDWVASLVLDSKEFPVLTLQAFVRGIVLAGCGDEQACPSELDILKDVLASELAPMGDASNESDVRPDITVGMLMPASKASRLFATHLVTEVALANAHRIAPIWPMVRAHLLRGLRGAKACTAQTEKASVGLLRVALQVVQLPGGAQQQTQVGGSREHRAAVDEAVASVRTLLRLPKEIAPEFARFAVDSVVRMFDSSELRWSSAVARVLLALVQVDDYALARDGLRLALARVTALPALVASAHIGEVLEPFHALFARAGVHRQANTQVPSAQEDERVLAEALDLLLVLHSRASQRHEDAAQAMQAVEQALLEAAGAGTFPGLPREVRAHAAVLLGALSELPRLNQEQLLKVQAEFPQAFSAAPAADKTPPRRQSTSSAAEERAPQARRQSQASSGGSGVEDRTPPARRQSQGSTGSEDRVRRLSGEARASGSAAGAGAEADRLQRRASPPPPLPPLELEAAATKPRAPSAKSPSIGAGDDADEAVPLPRVDRSSATAELVAPAPAQQTAAVVEESAGEESSERAQGADQWQKGDEGAADDLR